MKNTFIILVCFFSFSIYATNDLNRNNNLISKVVNDTIKFNYKGALQKTVNLFIKKKLYSPINEFIYATDLLKSKEVTEGFAKNLIFIRHPEIKSLPYEFEISEDNSKKLWFVYMEIPGTLDGGIFMIIIKNNCKVLFFSNLCCPK